MKKPNPPMSFRPTRENSIRLEELVKRLECDNPNATLNKIIKDYHFYEKNKNALFHLRALAAALKEEK